MTKTTRTDAVLAAVSYMAEKFGAAALLDASEPEIVNYIEALLAKTEEAGLITIVD